jgi:hypothetical protein
MSADSLKTLKESGVPLGARIVFRLQWVPFITLALLLVATFPFVFLWGLIHESAHDFIQGCNDVLKERLERITRHRERLIGLYAKEAA